MHRILTFVSAVALVSCSSGRYQEPESCESGGRPEVIDHSLSLEPLELTVKFSTDMRKAYGTRGSYLPNVKENRWENPRTLKLGFKSIRSKGTITLERDKFVSDSGCMLGKDFEIKFPKL